MSLLSYDTYPIISYIRDYWIEVRKKGGGIRLCVDIKGPKKAVIADSFPLPHTEELMNSLVGATMFSKLDLASAYLSPGSATSQEPRHNCLQDSRRTVPFQAGMLWSGICPRRLSTVDVADSQRGLQHSVLHWRYHCIQQDRTRAPNELGHCSPSHQGSWTQAQSQVQLLHLRLVNICTISLDSVRTE